jgi:flagellar motility protein MotE (MotC chaperone)
MKLRVRLLPAVAGGAAALLLLKGIDLLRPTPVAQTISMENPDNSPFTSAILRVRNYKPVDPETTGSTAAPPKVEEKKPDPPAGKPVKLDEPPVSPAERGLLQKLGERREQLEERQRELDTRENLLKAADKKLDQRIQDLKLLEGKGLSPEGEPQKDGTDQQALKNLVTMYEAMKPKEAARVFDRLNLAVLVPVVNAMNPRKMSEILAAMSPEAAEKLTVALAGGGLRGTKSPTVGAASLPAGELQSIEQKRP